MADARIVITQKAQENQVAAGFAGLSLSQERNVPAAAEPPRPVAPPRLSCTAAGDEDDVDDEDDDDPFGDKNVISTPTAERGEPRW